MLTFTSSAQLSAVTETPTGTRTPAPTQTVNLSWSASSSPDISGYNIYCAVYLSSCGSYSKINGQALDTSRHNQTLQSRMARTIAMQRPR